MSTIKTDSHKTKPSTKKKPVDKSTRQNLDYSDSFNTKSKAGGLFENELEQDTVATMPQLKPKTSSTAPPPASPGENGANKGSGNNSDDPNPERLTQLGNNRQQALESFATVKGQPNSTGQPTGANTPPLPDANITPGAPGPVPVPYPNTATTSEISPESKSAKPPGDAGLSKPLGIPTTQKAGPITDGTPVKEETAFDEIQPNKSPEQKETEQEISDPLKDSKENKADETAEEQAVIGGGVAAEANLTSMKEVEASSIANGSPNEVVQSVGSLDALSMAASFKGVNEAYNVASTNINSEIDSDKLRIDQPTGLKEGQEAVKPKNSVVKKSVDIQGPKAQDKAQTSIETKVEVDRSSERKINAISKPNSKSGFFSKLASMSAFAQPSNQSIGKKPAIELTGDADPALNDKTQQEANLAANAQFKESTIDSTKDHGEFDVLPTVPTEKMESEVEMKKLDKKEIKSTDLTQNIDPEFADFYNSSIEKTKGEERKQLLSDADSGEQEFKSEKTRVKTEQQQEIANEEQKAANDQTDARTQNISIVESYREMYAKENEENMTSFNEELATKRGKANEEIKTTVDETNTKVSDKYTDADKKVKDKKRSTDSKIANEKAKANKKEKSWWEKATDAIGDFFTSIRKAVAGFVSELKSFVKDTFEKAKEFAVKAIDYGRDLVNKSIKTFGEGAKFLINKTVGVVFPETAKRWNDKIDKGVAKAQQFVNKVAEGLKVVVTAILDTMCTLINALIDTYAAILDAVLQGLEALAKFAVEMAHYFFDMFLYRIRMMATLVQLGLIVIGGLLTGVAWDAIGLVDGMQEKVLVFLFKQSKRVLEQAPDDIRFGIVWTLVRNMLLGFLDAYIVEKDGAEVFDVAAGKSFMDQFCKIVTGRDMAFMWAFIKNLFIGLWDGLKDTFVMLWDIIRFIAYDLWVGIAKIYEWLKENGNELWQSFSEFGSKAVDVIKTMVENKDDGPGMLAKLSSVLTPEKIVAWLNKLANKIRNGAREGGKKLGNSFKAYMASGKMGADLGKALGYLTGMILFEVALAFLTVGIGSAIKWGGKAVAYIVRFLKAFGKAGRSAGVVIKVLSKGFGILLKFAGKAIKWAEKATGAIMGKAMDLLGAFGKLIKKVIKSLGGSADEIAEIGTKYGDEGAEALMKHGDEGGEALLKHGDEAGEVANKRRQVDETLSPEANKLKDDVPASKKAEMDADAKKQLDDDANLKKDSPEYAEKMAALSAAKAVTEGADKKDLPTTVLKALLKPIKAKFNAVTDFVVTKPKMVGNALVYGIKMLGSEYWVDKYYDINTLGDDVTPEMREEMIQKHRDYKNRNKGSGYSDERISDRVKNGDEINPESGRFNTKPRKKPDWYDKPGTTDAQRKAFDERGKLRERNNTPEFEQAHHPTSIELVGNNKVVGDAVNKGYDINKTGVNVEPYSTKHVDVEGNTYTGGTHASHPNYSQSVDDIHRKFGEQYKSGNYKPEIWMDEFNKQLKEQIEFFSGSGKTVKIDDLFKQSPDGSYLHINPDKLYQTVERAYKRKIK